VSRHRVRQRLRVTFEGLAAAFGRFVGRVASKVTGLAESLPIPAAAVAGAAVAALAIVVAGSSGDELTRAQGAATRAPARTVAAHHSSPPSPATPDESRRPDPSRTSRAVRVVVARGADGQPRGAEVGPRRPDQTHFACVSPTPVTGEQCIDSASRTLARLLRR
jgi:hypothetical protein